MLLGCAVSELPNYVDGDRQQYIEVFRSFLFKHYNKSYFEIGPEKFEAAVGYTTAGHLIIGETARTAEHDKWHAVVGVRGKMYWDVHPSRSGLTNVRGWGLFLPAIENVRGVSECYCPNCSKVGS